MAPGAEGAAELVQVDRRSAVEAGADCDPDWRPRHARVTFPASARWSQGYPPPLKLQVEESAEGMSPRNVWQVYALGGFMILRCMWARWRERTDRGNSAED